MTPIALMKVYPAPAEHTRGVPVRASLGVSTPGLVGRGCPLSIRREYKAVNFLWRVHQVEAYFLLSIGMLLLKYATFLLVMLS